MIPINNLEIYVCVCTYINININANMFIYIPANSDIDDVDYINDIDDNQKYPNMIYHIISHRYVIKIYLYDSNIMGYLTDHYLCLHRKCYPPALAELLHESSGWIGAKGWAPPSAPWPSSSGPWRHWKTIQQMPEIIRWWASFPWW